MGLKLAIVFLVAGPAMMLALAQDRPKTTSDGIYTDAQAKRGETLYSQACASCHGPDLSGDAAPSLSGDGFSAGWNDLSVADLADRIRTTMPADAPGSLSRQQAVDLVSFILSKSRFPAGQTELPAQDEVLKQIKIARDPKAR
jgi:mono/diheme cytochrome c family protein